jgi:CheY-like chemotaxis protein
MSHEIRSPMNGILGFLNLLDQPDLSDADRSNFINIVNKSGERLMNTINDIVEISKIEVGDINLVNQDFDVSELMQFHFDFFKIQTDEKGIDFSITEQLVGKPAVIKTDMHKLDGILMNLIRNAIKFTTKGTIKIGNYIENDNLYFYVTDSGRGIREDKLEVIFDRFVQAELGNTRGFEGSGLGLSIVKAYIEALNGTIEVKSEVGKGSTFLFSIPYHPAIHTFDQIETTQSDKIISSKCTILVAEDDEVNFYYLENILSKEYSVLHAVSGEEAVKLFMDNPGISLILMDIRMPGDYDGLEATRRIRQMNQEVPIIAQTAYAMEFDKTRVFEAGCNNYISKPFTTTDLKILIEQYCNKRDNSD